MHKSNHLNDLMDDKDSEKKSDRTYIHFCSEETFDLW